MKIQTKKTIPLIFLILFNFLITNGYSQSKILKVTVSGGISRHTIQNLVPLRPDHYNTAVNDQLGVIGDNFHQDEMITVAKNDNDWEKTLTPTDYFTVLRPGPKMTFCGKIIQNEMSSGIVDDDLNIQISAYPKNTAFDAKYIQIKNRTRNLYPWSIIEGEIDINESAHKFFDPHSNSTYKMPALNTSNVCLYGPWVEEVYDSDEDINPNKDHADVHEIHPAEQFWWAEKNSAGMSYYLNAAIDASGRFEESNWINSERRNTFAIAFDISLKNKEKQEYKITDICHIGINPSESDGRTHYLIYAGDTLLKLAEPGNADLFTVTFEDVGLDPYRLLNNSDSVIKGFIVLQNIIKNTSQGHGVIKSGVTKQSIYRALNGTRQILVTDAHLLNAATSASSQNTTINPVNTNSPKRVKVTLKEIASLENVLKSGLLPKPLNLTGYIYANIESPNADFSSSSNSILFNKPALLFPVSPNQGNNRVIKHGLVLDINHSIKTQYSNSLVLNLANNEKIDIVTDFVASYVGSYIRTLELNNDTPYSELKIGITDLQRNIPVVKEIIMKNWERNSNADPKSYTMKIKLEFLLLD